MSNLYARLAKSEAERTEALADLLERVLACDRGGTERFAEFVSGVLLARVLDGCGKTALANLLGGSPATVSVVTQYRIDDGSIPDLVIFSGGVPVCAVEVKIDAEIGMGQLEGYGEWLKARAGEGMPAALVLLTHTTPVPDEFMRPGDGPYGVTLRGAAYWNEVSAGKTIVIGMRDRKSKQVKLKVIPSTKRPIIESFVLRGIETGARIYRDQHKSYQKLPRHKSVNHSRGEYVRGKVHTNGIESIWALFKRGESDPISLDTELA